ncbi:DUF423 domain-containing protein [Brevibacillus sp. SYSU BS000544]|uniref:DUF423 domain-containing protein n=1 Tax=Brevibacillus sp. SYSU BS000544 TaxID=3416443 RepID=UPI003CE47F52
MRFFLFLGSINMFLAVALGAFGAHGLKAMITPEKLAVYQTGVHYHMIHALGLLAVALLLSKNPQSSLLNWSGWAMFIGIILFSGSLYVLSVYGLGKLGIITPIGGLAFLIGWLLLATAAWKV